MIIWVRVETLAKYETGNGDFNLKRKFEQVSGEPCLVLHMSQATPALVGELKPRALLLSGCGTWFRDFDVREFYVFEDLVRAFPQLPTLAFCGSHQLLGFVYNHGFRNLERVIDEPMRRLRPGEPQVGAVSADSAGYFVEQGFYPITALQPDPLFAGLPDPFMVRESHTCEIKQLPAGFELIATNENCRIQAIKHRERPLWGTQFHPEAWQDEYPHGRQVLANFFRLAGIIH
ncbi:MAG: gamma-glutamyl-gamma-aminobutyrate hydrolase family protein [Candidatus Latescibacteria bacterium]|nr:gamma-glutamyl-gamma-aminobutyrate hydrolase family protein [Candidatus Latescibacterota bacterium]